MRTTPLARGSTLVEHGREERVRKANRPGSLFDYMGVERRLEHSVRGAHIGEQLRGGTAERRCE